jgi:ATP-dependent Lon protease
VTSAGNHGGRSRPGPGGQERKPSSASAGRADRLAGARDRLVSGNHLAVGDRRPASIGAAQEAVRTERTLGVILQTDSAIEDPKPEHLYRVGTSARILRYITAPDGAHHIICNGVRRFASSNF